MLFQSQGSQRSGQEINMTDQDYKPVVCIIKNESTCDQEGRALWQKELGF